jgi:hypothetical protein
MWHKENHSNTKSYAKAAHFAGAFAAHEMRVLESVSRIFRPYRLSGLNASINALMDA